MAIVPNPSFLAAGFTLGCWAIHALRRHADVLTPPLVFVLMIMTMIDSILWMDRLWAPDFRNVLIEISESPEISFSPY